MKALVFAARKHDFLDEKTGRQVVGNSISYLEDMPPYQEPNRIGLAPMAVPALDDALAEVFKTELPAIFDFDFGRRADAKGKPVTIVTRAKFVSLVPIHTLLNPGK